MPSSREHCLDCPLGALQGTQNPDEIIQEEALVHHAVSVLRDGKRLHYRGHDPRQVSAEQKAAAFACAQHIASNLCPDYEIRREPSSGLSAMYQRGTDTLAQ